LANPPGADPLQVLGHLRHAVVFAGAHEDVDGVWPKLEAVYDHAQLLGRLLEALSTGPPYHLVQEDAPPVFERELEVVVGLADVMVTSDQLYTNHLSSPARRTASGNSPI